MKFDIITIFPDFFKSVFSYGVINKALENKIIEIDIHDLRKYSDNKHNTVDDKPYGGGSGMLMTPQPFGRAIKDIRKTDKKSLVILTSPQGKKLDQKITKTLTEYEQIVILCGRYEGIDERIKELFVDIEISIGDYILSGGEYAASLIIDSTSRLIPGVLGNDQSPINESFDNNLLEYPQYTRPETYKELKVPDILLSGNHEEIKLWRKNESIKKTYLKKPELLDESILNLEETNFLKNFQNDNRPSYKVFTGLVHYPVYNKDLETITTAFTNLDAHDIARASKTYGIEKFYLINPIEEQKELVKRVIDHWTKGPGMEFNPSRKEALDIVSIKNSIEETISEIEKIEGKRPKIVVTDARIKENMVGYKFLRDQILKNDSPFLILFGTGWGLVEEIIDSADYILKPIRGYNDFNHLSVRSAAAIILDRLLYCKI